MMMLNVMPSDAKIHMGWYSTPLPRTLGSAHVQKGGQMARSRRREGTLGEKIEECVDLQRQPRLRLSCRCQFGE